MKRKRRPLLGGLFAEARKYPTYQEFEHAYSIEIKNGLYWHVTDNPEFRIDASKGPRDMSSMAVMQAASVGRLMITSHLEYWASHYQKTRKYAALIDMSAVPPLAYYQVNRGMGNEFMVSDTSHARVVAVMPIAKARALDRRHYRALPQSAEALKKLYDAAHAEAQ